MVRSVAQQANGEVSMNSTNLYSQHSDAEQREFTRHKVTLTGELFVPDEKASFYCQVLNLSGGGAAVRCRVPQLPQSSLALYIDGFWAVRKYKDPVYRWRLGLAVCMQ